MGQGADIISDGTRLVARPAGDMDADAGDRFAEAIAGRLAAGTGTVTVDLSALDRLSLGAVRSFLRLGRSLKAGGRSLDFANGSDPVRHAFEAAGFHDFFAFSPPLHLHRGHHDDETP